jgi:predicted aldo/keto reductase-like oxidoreductase
MVTRTGFGGIPIQRLAEDDAVSVVGRCLDLGVNFIDTARNYTTSEERIGKAIAGRREGLIIATKTHAMTAEDVEKELDMSLKLLGIDSVDLYQLHQVGTFEALETVLAPKGPLAAVKAAKKAGKIRHIGLTSHSLDVAKEAVKSDRFETIMFPFNFIVREAADALLPLAMEHDVGFIAMKPLAGGMLDNAGIALKFLLQYPDVVPIPGIETHAEIEEIVKICEGPAKITAAENQEMQRLRAELGTRFCRRCDYCQPCTEGIPISTVMISESFARRLPPARIFSGRIAEALEKAAGCTECGECEQRCPYELPIREMMAEQVKWFNEARKRYSEKRGE